MHACDFLRARFFIPVHVCEDAYYVGHLGSPEALVELEEEIQRAMIAGECACVHAMIAVACMSDCAMIMDACLQACVWVFVRVHACTSMSGLLICLVR